MSENIYANIKEKIKELLAEIPTDKNKIEKSLELVNIRESTKNRSINDKAMNNCLNLTKGLVKFQSEILGRILTDDEILANAVQMLQNILMQLKQEHFIRIIPSEIRKTFKVISSGEPEINEPEERSANNQTN